MFILKFLSMNHVETAFRPVSTIIRCLLETGLIAVSTIIRCLLETGLRPVSTIIRCLLETALRAVSTKLIFVSTKQTLSKRATFIYSFCFTVLAQLC